MLKYAIVLTLNISNVFPFSMTGCEYGDKPVSINTPRGTLNCADYIRYAGETACNDSEIRSYCCYTCYRYRQARLRAGQWRFTDVLSKEIEKQTVHVN